MSECKPNWRGRETHCFEARYDSLQPQSPEFITPIIATIMFSEDKVAAIEHMRSEIYIYDVCTRCGKTIERTSEGKSNG